MFFNIYFRNAWHCHLVVIVANSILFLNTHNTEFMKCSPKIWWSNKLKPKLDENVMDSNGLGLIMMWTCEEFFFLQDCLMTAYVSTFRPRGQDFGFPTAFPEFPTQYSPFVTPWLVVLCMFPWCYDPFDTCRCMFQIILNNSPRPQQITKTHKVKGGRLLMNIHS